MYFVKSMSLEKIIYICVRLSYKGIHRFENKLYYLIWNVMKRFLWLSLYVLVTLMSTIYNLYMEW